MIKEPERIARLPHDKRGFPIPWNVLRGVDDAPIFTVNDERKSQQALTRELCPICGERLGRWKWWVGGPRAAFDEHGWYIDLPVHQECAHYALQTCPYLASPRYVEDHRVDVPDPSKLLPEHRVLVDQTFQRQGGTTKVHVDVRIISSTARNLEEEIATGRFREDLYHRLSVVPIRVPPRSSRSATPCRSVLLAKQSTRPVSLPPTRRPGGSPSSQAPSSIGLARTSWLPSTLMKPPATAENGLASRIPTSTSTSRQFSTGCATNCSPRSG